MLLIKQLLVSLQGDRGFPGDRGKVGVKGEVGEPGLNGSEVHSYTIRNAHLYGITHAECSKSAYNGSVSYYTYNGFLINAPTIISGNLGFPQYIPLGS